MHGEAHDMAEGLFGKFVKAAVTGLVAEGLRQHADEVAAQNGQNSFAARLVRTWHGVVQSQAGQANGEYQAHSQQAWGGGIFDQLKAAYLDTALGEVRQIQFENPGDKDFRLAVQACRDSDRDKFFHHLSKAVDAGHPQAFYAFGCFCFKDIGRQLGIPRDYETARIALTEALNRGHPEAAAALRELDETIRAAPLQITSDPTPSKSAMTADEHFAAGMAAADREDFSEAASWFRQAANLGHGGAMGAMGFYYMTGVALPHDEVEAARWFRMSADKGNEAGFVGLGLCYRDGLGSIARDRAAATHWLGKAAQAGNQQAADFLAEMAAEDRANAITTTHQQPSAREPMRWQLLSPSMSVFACAFCGKGGWEAQKLVIGHKA